MQCQYRRAPNGLTIIEALTLLVVCISILFVVVPTKLAQQGVLKPVEAVGAAPPARPKLEPIPALDPIPPPPMPTLPPLPPRKNFELEGLMPDSKATAPGEPAEPNVPTPPTTPPTPEN